jgi:hypothetical protein
MKSDEGRRTNDEIYLDQYRLVSRLSSFVADSISILWNEKLT